MGQVTLKQLSIFYETAKHKSISTAAYNTFITQPSASKALKQLEKSLGYSLFKRGMGTKEVKLTPKGDELYKEAKNILAQASDLESLSKINNIDPKEISGSITIGASVTISDYILPKHLVSFQKKYPNIKIKITKGNTDNITSRVKSSDCDIGLIEGEVSDSSIKSIFWKEDNIVIIASTKNPLSKKETTTKDMLFSNEWAVWKAGSGARDVIVSKDEKISISILSRIIKPIELENGKLLYKDIAMGEGSCILKDHNLKKRKISFDSPEAMKRYIANSMCVANISETVLKSAPIPNIKILTRNNIKQTRKINIITNNSGDSSNVTTLFIKWIKNIAN